MVSMLVAVVMKFFDDDNGDNNDNGDNSNTSQMTTTTTVHKRRDWCAPSRYKTIPTERQTLVAKPVHQSN